MSTSATDPTKDATNGSATVVTDSPKDKGKGKAPAKEDAMDEDEDSSDDEEDSDEDGDDSDEDGEDSGEEDDRLEKIDPSVIVGRRTRGVKVDYTSAEALSKAGLTKKDEEDDDDEDVKMKD